MEEMVTIPRKEYEELKRKAETRSEIEREFQETLEDLKRKRVCTAKDLEDI